MFDGEVCWVNTRMIAYISNANRLKNGDAIAFEPIPLTEEWLLKFGFVNGGKSDFDKKKLSIHLPSFYYTNGRTFYNSWRIMDYSVKSVHQLQNLYFALTGEELEIQNT